MIKWVVTGTLGLVFLMFFALVATDPGDNVKLLEAGIRTDTSGARFVTGSLKTATGGSYYHAQVEINLLDASGSVVGSTTLEKYDFGGSEPWCIEAPIVTEDAVRFRFEKLTCRKTPESTEWEMKRASALTYEGVIE